jgi:steroid 5-alpha reductase family enzyme
MKQNFSKGTSLAMIAGMYVIAIGIGVLNFARALDVMPEMWALLLADVLVTVVIWGWGIAYENVSVYDPYWSVIPPVAFTGWAIYKGCFTLPVILLLVAVWVWGIRLTGNWVWTFKGLGHEDWRYTRYREKLSPFLFQVTNFFGLNLMPTLLVFTCMLPGFGLFDTADANWLTWVGFALCLLATGIELVADIQSHRFRGAHPGKVCDAGLWKHGRHPNYFGEILMWWGVWVMYASLHGIDWLMLAPFAMTDLFLFISIPMMERRQLATKPEYAAYRKKTRLFI